MSYTRIQLVVDGEVVKDEHVWESNLNHRLNELKRYAMNLKEGGSWELVKYKGSKANAGRKAIGFTPKEIDRMFALRRSGISYEKIGQIFRVSESTIYYRVNGRERVGIAV